jgi:uridine monophosphate synthetase
MIMTFFQRLTERVDAVDSLLCVGLDPRGESAAALRDDCLRLIDTTVDFAAIYKPNIAFFEAFGPEGIAVLKEVIAHVPPGVPVLLDAKRADIPDTSAAYATAAFAELGAHAITANPYLGPDALAPFLAEPQHGVFVLCRTSNPGSCEMQELPVAVGHCTAPLYEVVARRAQAWSQHDNLGLVVGANDLDAMARVRAVAPDLWFLVPGVGAQGGELAGALAAGLRNDGRGLLINASRQLARATDPGQAARRLRDAINEGRAAHGKSAPARSLPSPLAQLAQILVETGCVRFGEFTLKSGALSPIYMDMRRLVTYPAALRQVARAYADKLQELSFDRLAGIPYAALPIGTAISLEMNRPLVYPRREAKEYGTKATVEGEFNAGETAVVVDDLTTTGGSKFEAIEKLEAAGLVVRDVVVLIDRMQGAGETLAAAGYRLHTVVTLPALLDEWLRQGTISATQHETVTAFLQQPKG